MDNAYENARSREWSYGDGYSRHNMAQWQSALPAGERQYLTQQERERQWLNHEKEAAIRAHYNSLRQNSPMDFRGHGAQATQPPHLYHQDHHRMAPSQNIRDWPNLYGPLRGQASPNVTLHRSGEITETWAKHEPHFPSYEFLPPLIVERGHEDITHHHKADRDYMVGRIVNHNNLHCLESKWQMLDPTHSNGHARGHFNEHSRGHSNSYSRIHSTECSKGSSRGRSSARSRGGSSGRSRGGSSARSRGGSSACSRGGSSVCSRGGSSGRSRGGSSGRSRGGSSGRSRGGSSGCPRGGSSGRSRSGSSGCSRGGSSGRSRSGSSGRSRGGSSGRSRGGSSRRSRGGSSGRSRGGSSGCSRGGSSGSSSVHFSRSPRLDFQAKHVNPFQSMTNSSTDIQNANITPTVPMVNNKHSETTSGHTTGPARYSTSLVFTDFPSTGGTESGVVDLKAAQVTHADTHGILGPSVPSQAITQHTDHLPGNAALVSHTQTSTTPEQQHASSPSLTDTPQEKPHKHKISLKEIQHWPQSVLRSKNGPVNGNNSTQDPSQSLQFSTEKMYVLQAGKTQLHLNTKDYQARPPERFSDEDSAIRLEIKSNPRYMTLTAVATAPPPPVAIVPPMGPQQSPEPMETENAGNELPFKILQAWSINEKQAENLWERAKDDASSLSVLNEMVQVESLLECDKPVDASAISSMASTGEDNDEVLQVITQMDKRSPSPFVHTNPQATDIVCIGGAQIIVEGSSNVADENTLDLSTIAEVQFKLCALQQLDTYLESATTVTEAEDGCLEAILELYRGGDTSDLVEALKDQMDEKIMQDVSAWAAEDEKAVVLFAVSGISLGEVLEKFPIPVHVDTSSQVGYRSSWLNVNEKLNDIDKDSGRAWSLWFIPDKAEDSSKVVGGVQMDDTFHSKMETVEFPAEAIDSDLTTNTHLTMDVDPPTNTDLPTNADLETEPLSPMILTVLTPEDAVKLLAETEAPDTDLKTVVDLTTDSDTEPLSPMNLTILRSEDAMRLFCQIENGSDLQFASPESCSKNKDKTQTNQLENIESGSLDKSCYCPCGIETDNGFEMGLCSSCQREKGLQQDTRCITIAHCFTMSHRNDQETEVPKDSGGKVTAVDNQCRDKKQTHSTEEEGDDNKTQGEMQQWTGVIPIIDFFFWSDTSEDSDQETEESYNEQHAQIEAHASSVKRTEPETDAKAPCESAQERTTQSKVSPGSEDRERWQEKDQDCRMTTLPLPKVENPSKLRANIIADNWFSPIEDCGSPVEKYDKVADFVTQYKTCKSKQKGHKKMEKEKSLHPTSSDRQSYKKSHGRAERGRTPSQTTKCYGLKATVDNQCRDMKPHAPHKTRHSTESDGNRCKDKKRGSSTVKACEGCQSRDKKPPKRRHSTEKEREDNQSRDKMSQKRRYSTETDGRNSNSKELQCQLVDIERSSGSSLPCPGVKTLHVQGSSNTTVPLKISINIPKKPSINASPSKHAEEILKIPKTKAQNKTNRHCSLAKSVSPVVKERQRNGGKQKQTIQCLKIRLEKLSLPQNLVRKGSPPSRKREEGSPPRQKRVADRGEPEGLGVNVSRHPDLSKKLKRKAQSDLKSQQNLTKIPKMLNGVFSKSECKNDSPPRILKLPRTPEVSKDLHERENRKEPSPSASPESQMLDKPARVAHKPKYFIKPASPSCYSPGSHACPNTAMVSPSHSNVDFCEKVSARQQVFSDWESSFVPTPTPRTCRRSGCPPEEVEGQQASRRSSSETRIIRPILKRVDAPPKPKRNISFPLNPRNVHYFKPCEYENYVMFNRSYTDPEDAQRSDDEEEDASVNCQNKKKQPPVMEAKQQDIGELKPGPSGLCEKRFKRKWEMQEPAAILMKESIVQAKHWTKSLHRDPPKEFRHSAKITGVGYKWSEKQKKRPNEIEGSSLNASPLHGHHPGSSQNASHGHHPGSSQNASPRHGHCPRSAQNASHGHHLGSSQNVSPCHGHCSRSSQNASHGHHPGSSQNVSPRHGHCSRSSQNVSPRHGHCSRSTQNVSPRHGHHPGSSQNASPRHGHCPRSSQNVSPLVVTIHPPARGEELSQQPGTIALPWMNGTSGGRERRDS
ncbi:uncharacterized protein LOC110490318 isoform X3 [Oncorhynchus mykiss]|uniref:uncharacterized protein LOC110490318 isoform X2 n=1 Tax=Oncorhynchus mykiss TaxID=8022 RepID=UPI0018783E34|nr:uncharacterized protein LOC110490318 isoform X2 [Oncorhynchus mykiss]XP_036800514.1 uncharacterized protein LOC110490318 isoform X3 [Oncorhynchus mykiss]